jgi:polyisoprenoid-binding protein YceI
MNTENKMMLRRLATVILFSAFTATAIGAPVTYNIDPNHTYPAFEADHMGGISVWRGKIKSTTGTIVLDKEAQTGTVDVTMDMSSIDFGHEKLNGHTMSADMLDVENNPTATYTGKLVNFKDGGPTAVNGNLTLHGVTKPVNLTLNTFRCMDHPRTKKEFCGADASARFNRDDFGIDFGKQGGFLMYINLMISIEAGIAD